MIQKIIDEIRTYPGITRKADLGMVKKMLESVAGFGNVAAAAGEDAAALQHNGSFLLLAADGILSGLIEDNPYGAGKASVMASVNDIYAMGGRPLAMVNVIGVPGAEWYDEIMRGIRKGCEKFRVPMLGGHVHPDAVEPSLSVSILGEARSLLLSTNARAGQKILFAVDLEGMGYQCKPVLSWDTNSGKTSGQVLARLEVLPQIAEKGLCKTAKDVSNAGLIGTVAILMETSGVGADIVVDDIPRPHSFPLNDWLKAFLSYGFVLCVDQGATDSVIEAFSKQHITAAVIGTVTEERKVSLASNGEQGVAFDLDKEQICGITESRRQ